MVRIVRVTALLALLGVLAACGGGAGDSGGVDGGGVPEAGAPPGAGDQDSGAGESLDEDRQVVVTGSMTLVVGDPVAAADEVAAVVEDAGGRVDSRSQSSGDETSPPVAYVTVRVPAEDLEATIERLSGLGDVEDLDLSREDVTLQVTDLDARIEALQVSVDRLEGLMADATSTADLLAAESALTQRQAELDSLTAQRAHLAEQVELSTIAITLLPETAVAAPRPGGFLGGVQRGWNALVTAFNAVVVVLGVLLPWAVLAAAVVGVVLLVRRALPRRPAPVRPAPPGGHAPGAYAPPAPPPGGYAPPPGAPPVVPAPPRTPQGGPPPAVGG
jgi:hypothetical protein